MAIQPLEAELLGLLGGDQKARIVSRYCGFYGLGGTTLQTVGSEFGITAQRVRQIVGEVIRRRGSSISPAPSLLRAERRGLTTVHSLLHQVAAIAPEAATPA